MPRVEAMTLVMNSTCSAQDFSFDSLQITADKASSNLTIFLIFNFQN